MGAGWGVDHGRRTTDDSISQPASSIVHRPSSIVRPRVLAIVDYGAGNLRSIHKALERVCAEAGSNLQPLVTSDPVCIEGAVGVVLPGVGAAGPTMRRLAECGLVEPVRAAAADRPFLGICLGLQLLLSWHEEGEVQGLGVLEGEARRLNGAVKLPHIGWNRLHMLPHPMFEGIESGTYFYYVHSYSARPLDAESVVGVSRYGGPFCAALARGRLWGTQFHPEKSGQPGLRLLANFVRSVEAC
jgi:imidazole glycerol-phosphate synthase subunit HisH